MSPLDPAALRPIQILWAAVLMAGAAMTTAFAWLGLSDTGAAFGASDLVFYGNAGFNVLAIAVAFAIQRRVWDRAATATTDEETLGTLRSLGLVSIAIMEASSLVAGLATFLTGEAVNLLFAFPFFAFGLLFFPTQARVEALLALRRR